MLKSKKNIILIGMMGCGKTTIARLLKDQLKMNWIDMDIYIEDKYLKIISDKKKQNVVWMFLKWKT